MYLEPPEAARISDLADIFRAYGTGQVSDALDLIGVNGGLVGLRRVSGAGVVVGPAFTLEFEEVEVGQAAPAADYIDEVPEGSMVVIANSGRTDVTVWGDILAAVALRRGIAGTVIDGCCRDLDDIRECGYPLWCKGSFMKSGKNRVRLRAVQQVIVACGVTVRPSDIVCADGSGVLVVPGEVAGRAAEGVRRVAEMEALVRADVDGGIELREARRRRGYHGVALQPAVGGSAVPTGGEAP